MNSSEKHQDLLPYDWELLTEEEKAERLYNVLQEIARIYQNIVEALTPIIKNVISTANRIWEAIFHTYPNKRVVWLAMHHPKERVRKKNRNRIIKWINLLYKREGKK